MIWCCPRCHSGLSSVPTGLRCGDCGSTYELFSGIPDFRVGGAAWIDLEADRALARQLHASMRNRPTEALIREIFRQRGQDDAWVTRRTGQVLDAPARLVDEIRGWLAACTAPGQLFLDLGCGPGMLLAAASRDGRSGIGVDISLVWLLAAQRLIRDHGGTPVLAAAFAEALPLPDGSVSGVAALDVIEHVADQPAMLREIDRVTAPGGHLALSTPNRLSLGPEPHVGVWGVGWLPRRFQDRYVRWRSGRQYGLVLSLSPWDAERLLRQNSSFHFQLQLPEIPTQEIAHFPARKASLARVYNRLVRTGRLDPILLPVGPFFRIVGAKSDRAAAFPDTSADRPVAV